MAKVTLRGKAYNTCGELPAVGQAAPDLLFTTTSLKDISISELAGHKRLLYFVPSLDTPVCANTTAKLDDAMTEYPDAKALVISADLPFALGRFAGSQKLKNIVPFSLFRCKESVRNYGVVLIDGPLAGLAARAVLVIDENGAVVYSQWVKEIADEPDFSQALAML